MKTFYIYAYYFKSTNEIFYIGKGTGNRYLDIVHSRNEYFKNIISKYFDDVNVKLLYENLEEDKAFELEKKLIKEYWGKGECKANFHEGGCGGNTGNYDSPIRHEKLSKFAKSRKGELNPMYGKTHSEKTKKLLSEINKGKVLSPEHKAKLIAANTGRIKTEEERKTLSILNKGKKLSEKTYNKMMDKICPYEYVVYFNGSDVYSCLGHSNLEKYCKENFNISRSIMFDLIRKDWKPKFKKHMHLSSLKIERIYRIHNSVSTNPDECKDVGQSNAELFEVRNNQIG